MILKNPALISSSVSAFYTNISNRAVKTRMDISTISFNNLRVRHIVDLFGLDGESDSPIDKPDVRTSRGLANKGGVDGNVVLHI